MSSLSWCRRHKCFYWQMNWCWNVGHVLFSCQLSWKRSSALRTKINISSAWWYFEVIAWFYATCSFKFTGIVFSLQGRFCPLFTQFERMPLILSKRSVFSLESVSRLMWAGLILFIWIIPVPSSGLLAEISRTFEYILVILQFWLHSCWSRCQLNYLFSC